MCLYAPGRHKTCVVTRAGGPRAELERAASCGGGGGSNALPRTPFEYGHDTLNLCVCKVQSIMDDNCGEWVECMGVASKCGRVCWWESVNLWVWLAGSKCGWNLWECL